MEKLVSILTPCYNTGNVIHRLLTSVLGQSYPKIEMVIIDDGSTDNTRNIVSSFIPEFEKRGYLLKYVYQINSGQSVAINNGLKLVSGEYLAWPDSDDYYASSDAIQKMVERFDFEDQKVALVRCKMHMLDEYSLDVIGTRGDNGKVLEDSSLFRECLFGNFYFYPGCYMIHLPSFFAINGKDLYTEKDAGQNWQMFLPILYKYRCSTIDEYLFNVLVRHDSHSRGQYSGLERSIQKLDSYERTVLNTLDRIIDMPDNEREDLKEQIRVQYALKKFRTAARFRSFKRLKYYRGVLSDLNSYNSKEKMLFLFSFIPGLLSIITWIHLKFK